MVQNADGSFSLNVNVFDNLGNSTNINVIININWYLKISSNMLKYL